MRSHSPSSFHKLYGPQKPRIEYYAKDFLDYALMLALSALVIGLSYGSGHVMSLAGFALCAFALAVFAIRHGVDIRVPVIVRRPQDVLYMFVYKLQNLRSLYFSGLGLLLLENALIAATPTLPHHVDLMRTVGLYLLFSHFIALTAYRTVSLIDHLAKKELVREALMQTPWKRVVSEKTNITLEIIHAYCTGVLTHIVLIAPWYLVITHASFSVIFLPVVATINFAVQSKWVRAHNEWFYRDHWLGHNSECEFIYLHGTHHDAIPSGLIAVSDNGLLEGFMRYTIGAPLAFFNPVVPFAFYTIEVKMDIDLHQYIPGVFPRLSRSVLEVFQHSTHHYGRLEPYSVGAKRDQPGIAAESKRRFAWLPDEMANSFKLDEELTGLAWDNSTHRNTLALFDKYQERHETV